MPLDITKVDGSGRDMIAAEIENRLLQTLRQENTQSLNETIVLKATSDHGQLCGGLTASTSYGWVLIKTLWVEPGSRSAGLGTRLLEGAEAEARRLGCHGAWLDTSSPKACEFYRKRGYREFGSLNNEPNQHPEDHSRWFMKKEL